MTKSWALAALLILTVSPVNVQAVNLDNYIEFLIRQESRRQGADEAFCLAVAEAESAKGKRRFRTGLIGSPKSYYAPFNIHPDYLHLRGWRVDLLPINIEVGVRRLKAGPAVLPYYNTEMTKDYRRRVMVLWKKYKGGR